MVFNVVPTILEVTLVAGALTKYTYPLLPFPLLVGLKLVFDIVHVWDNSSPKMASSQVFRHCWVFQDRHSINRLPVQEVTLH